MSELNEISNGNSSVDGLPVVTVVIPAYNQQSRVKRAIQSVVDQDYPNKQICIIDPGSTDGTFSIIEKMIHNAEFKQIEPYGPNYVEGDIDGVKIYLLCLYKAKVEGPSAARNECIRFMWEKTHFFSMLDADDYYKVDKLTKTVNKMLFNPNQIGIVYNDLDIYHESNGVTIREFRQSFDRQILERENIITNSPLISKQALSLSGLYDESLRTCEDWDLWLRITEHMTAIHIPEALSVYSVTGQNSTDTVAKEEWGRNWQMVQEKLRQRIRN